jgi:hypothetical protein
VWLIKNSFIPQEEKETGVVLPKCRNFGRRAHQGIFKMRAKNPSVSRALNGAYCTLHAKFAELHHVSVAPALRVKILIRVKTRRLPSGGSGPVAPVRQLLIRRHL